MDTKLKSCLVTGCSEGGVGAAFAEVFQQKGYHVFATARSPSKVPKTLHSAPNVTVLALDACSSTSIAEAAKVVEKQTGGKLDVLINNAGHGQTMPGLNVNLDEARNLFNVNFFGVLELVQVFSPMLVKAKGCIVNNASIGGLTPIPFNSMYAASKASLISASEIWRLELAPLNVRVIVLITGGIATKFMSNMPSVELPENSYYRTIRDIIAKEPEEIPFAAKPEALAMDVLNYVERGTAGKIWIGGASSMARFAVWAFPTWLLDRFSLSYKPFAQKLAADHKNRIEG